MKDYNLMDRYDEKLEALDSYLGSDRPSDYFINTVANGFLASELAGEGAPEYAALCSEGLQYLNDADPGLMLMGVGAAVFTGRALSSAWDTRKALQEATEDEDIEEVAEETLEK